MDQTAFEVDQSLGSEADFDKAHYDYESLDVQKRAVSVLSDAAHDTPQDLMQLQTLMLVPSDARDQLAQSVQHREEPMVPEIAVHTFYSHRVQATNKQLVVKRACKRREWDAVQNRQLPVQSLTAFIKQTKTLSVTAVSKQNSLIEAMSVDTAHGCER